LVIPICCSLITEEFLAPESVYWIVSHLPISAPDWVCCDWFKIGGQPLEPSSDLFITEKVQPVVANYISRGTDWCIAFLCYFNMIILVNIVQMVQFVGTWNLLSYSISYENNLIRIASSSSRVSPL